MWYNPHGNYPISYNAADGLPNAFSYFGQTFVRRPDPIIVRKPPESPKSETGPSDASLDPPNDKPDPPPNVPPPPWSGYPNPMAQMHLNTFSMHHTHPPSQPPLPPRYPQQHHAPSSSIHSPPPHQNVPPHSAKAVLKQPQYYSQPHPSMWPTIPSGHDAYVLPQPTGLGTPAVASGGERTAAHQQSLAPDALKYKCTICGRYRSARYHYKHPLLPGHLPKKTICRKCRENATDSDEASTDSYEAKQGGRSKSQSRRPGGGLLVRRASSRSQSRGRRRSTRVSFQTDSSSSESSDLGNEKRKKHRQHPSTPAAETIRYVHCEPEHHLPQRIRTVYVNDPAPRQGVATSYQEVHLPRESDNQMRSRHTSRPPTPATRDVRAGYAEAPLPQQCRLRTEYFDGPIPEMNHHRSWRYSADPRSRRASQSIDREFRVPRQVYNDTSGRSSRSRGHDRDRHQYTEREERVNSAMTDDPNWVPRAPSPPRRSRYDHQKSYRNRNESPECGDNEVVVIETHEPEPREDYDWYDEQGMRVRVREI